MLQATSTASCGKAPRPSSLRLLLSVPSPFKLVLWGTSLSSCFIVFSQSSVKAYERALYGALAGDLHSVLPVCESWEDHLWAHINALFEDRIDHFLALPSTPNSYFAHEADFTANNTNSSSSKSEPKDLARVFDSLLQRSGRVGEEARHPFRIVVACIAQEQLAKLFQEFVWQMEKTAADLEPECAACLWLMAHEIRTLC